MSTVDSIPFTPGHEPRTHGEATLDLEFALELSVLSQRFYERLHNAITLITLVAGSAAFVTVFKPNSVVVTVAGLAVGMLTLVQQVYDFRGKGMHHAARVRRYQHLRSVSQQLSLTELDARLGRLGRSSIPVVQGLRQIAQNNMLRSAGYLEWVRPLSRWERLLAACV